MNTVPDIQAQANQVRKALAEALSGGQIYAPGVADIPDINSLDDSFAETAVIVQTSGSSAHPKRVALSASALKASAIATEKSIGSGPWILTLPINYIAGLQVINRAMLSDTPLIALNPDFDAEQLHKAIDSNNLADAKISLVAAQLGRLLDEIEALNTKNAQKGEDLAKSIARIDTMLIGGGRIDPKLRERATKMGWNTIATYGATETAGGCVYDGYPLSGVDLSLRAQGLAISGPMLALGYLPPVPDIHMRRFFTEDGKRWWDTGDRAQVTQGRLSILGRNDRTVDVGGLKANLDEIEALIGVPVVAIPDPQWGHKIIGFTTERNNLKPDFREILDAGIGKHAVPREFIKLANLPLNANGKIDYQALKRIAENE